MIYRRLTIGLSLIFLCFGLDLGAQNMHEAIRLYDHGMYSRARLYFDEIAADSYTTDPEGYAVLCDVRQRVPGYVRTMDRFLAENPQSPVNFQIRFAHALNLFDAHDYVEAGKEFDKIKVRRLDRGQRAEYMFKKAYCALENSQRNEALVGFKEVEKLPASDYTAASRYAIGYINYDMENFKEAIFWFEKSVKDSRFADMSSYYIMECRFMLSEYAYVTANGDEMYAKVPAERKPHLARIISESWLVLGNAEKAREYMELNAKGGGQPKGRADWFYRGSKRLFMHKVDFYASYYDTYKG